jgi:hypothetical protein
MVEAGMRRVLCQMTAIPASTRWIRSGRVVGTNLYEIPDVLVDGLWFWRVAAVDAAGNQSAWSSVGRVLFDAVPTPIPTLSEPANNLLTKDAVFTFMWSNEADVKRYNIQVDNESSFTAPYRMIPIPHHSFRAARRSARALVLARARAGHGYHLGYILSILYPGSGSGQTVASDAGRSAKQPAYQ